MLLLLIVQVINLKGNIKPVSNFTILKKKSDAREEPSLNHFLSVQNIEKY